MLIAEIIDKIPSLGDTATIGVVIAVLAFAAALLRWWLGAIVLVGGGVFTLASAVQDFTDPTLAPMIAAEMGEHYLWSQIAAACTPLALAALAVNWVRQLQLRRMRRRKGLCQCCGYRLGESGVGMCPECGFRTAQTSRAPTGGSNIRA